MHTERAELEKAQAALRDDRSFVDKAGETWIVSDHDALLAGLMGRITNAAHVAGYMDSTFAAKKSSRSRSEVRARNKLQSIDRVLRALADELGELPPDDADTGA